MGKKKAAGKKKAKETEETGPTYEKIAIPSDGSGWVKVNVKLVNWTFDNMSITLRTDTPLYSIVRQLKEKHGNMKELTLYKGQVNPSNQLADFDVPLKDLGFEGAENIEDAKSVTVYYDFKPVLESSPLLLITPRTY